MNYKGLLKEIQCFVGIFFLLFLFVVGKSTVGYSLSIIAYRDGGEILRTSILKKGSSFLEIFLPGCADPSTFSVLSSPPIKSISIKRIEGSYKKNVNRLKRRIDSLGEKIKEVKDQISINDTLLALWKAQVGFHFNSPKDLIKVDFLLRKKMGKIYLSQRKLLKEKKFIEEEIQHIEKEVLRLTGGKKYYYQVKVVFSHPISSQRISYSYFCYNIKWDSSYALRLYTQKKRCELLWMGRIYENTGDDWKDVDLKLSTLPHRERMEPFPLGEWIIVERRPVFYERAMRMEPARSPRQIKVKASTKRGKNRIHIEKKWFQEEIGVGQISLKTGESKEIVLQTLHPYVSYSYLYRPLSDRGVFFKADITLLDGDKRVIPAGSYDIFIDGSFRGKKHLSSIYNKASLFLGMDRGIWVRTTSEANLKGETGIVSKRATRRFLWKSVLKNNKDRRIKIHIEIPWPQSTNEKIKVKNLSKGFIVNGKSLVKDIVLLPGEKKEIEFGFLISYPKDMEIEIIRKGIRYSN